MTLQEQLEEMSGMGGYTSNPFDFDPTPVDTRPMTVIPPPTTAPAPVDPRMTDPTYAAQTEAREVWMRRNQGNVAPMPAPRTKNLQTDWASATQGLTANERDQTSLNAVAERLRGLGYDVSLPQTDEMGRNQGLNIDGKLYRVIDSSNRWTLGEGPGAWGGGGGDEFTDPWGRSMEQFTRAYQEALGRRPDSQFLDQYIKGLVEQQGASKARAQTLAGQLNERISSLKGPVYSDPEEAAMRAKAFDQLERRRAQTLKNRREEIYARGFAPTSGIVVGEERDVNRQFEQARTGIESDLLRSGIDERQNREREATQLAQIVAQVLEGGDINALTSQAGLTQLESQRQAEELARRREQIAATAGP